MYVKISSSVSWRFHQKAIILLWNSQFMTWRSVFFCFRPWTFPRACFNCEGKLFIQGGAYALPKIQWTAQSMLKISNWLLVVYWCIYDCHYDCVTVHWLKGSRPPPNDGYHKLTDRQIPTYPLTNRPSGLYFDHPTTHPAAGRLSTDCNCLSVCPQELSISYGEHLLADKRYEEAGLGIINQCLFVLCVQEYLDPSELFVLFLKFLCFSFFFSVFSRCGAHEQALSSFQKSGNWRQVFCMASLLHYTDEEVISLARNVAGRKVILPSHPLQSSLPNVKNKRVYCQESFLFAMII